MAMQKFKLYLSCGVGIYTKGNLMVSDFKPSDASAKDGDWGRVLIKEYEVELDIPEIDTRQVEIDALEAGIEKERAESQSRVNILLDRISKLKAITHEVAQ